MRRRRHQTNGEQSSVGVVYLAWHALGLGTFQRFADSYRRHPAGCDHELIVVYAGFQRQQDLSDATSVFRDVLHTHIEFSEVRFDIAYYLETARRLSSQYLCFLNTYTELTTDNWLGYLYRHISREAVGIVGAAGSYESLADSIGLQQRVIWHCRGSANRIDEQSAYYFDFVLEKNCPGAVIEPMVPLPARGIERWMERASRYLSKRKRDEAFRARWEALTSPGEVFAEYRRFPTFPNPHIRSSGFMVRRAHLAPFTPSAIKTKMDALLFESNAEGLTARIRKAGLAALVIANDGQGYDVHRWSRSSTYRLGDQAKLILTDNRSREFAGMSEAARSLHVRITWGDYAGPTPVDFPDFGYSFAKGSLSPDRPLEVKQRRLSHDPRYVGCKLALRAMRLVARVLPPGSGLPASHP